MKQSALRVAAALTAVVFMGVGATGPVYATDDSTTDSETASQQQAEETQAGEAEESEESDEAESDEAGQAEEAEEAQAGTEEDGQEESEESYRRGTTCDKLGYTKFDQPSGSEELDFGSLEWAEDTLTYVVDEGYTVDLCIKSGAKAPITEFTVTGASEGSKQIAQDISHIGYIIAEAAEETDSEETVEEEPAEAEESCPEGSTMGADGECVTAPAEESSCPEGSTMGADGECVTAPAEDGTCPEGATMSDTGECLVPAVPTEGEVAGAEQEDVVLGVEAERPAANRAPAAVAPASGILPATGAGEYTLALAAGAGLLAAGGALLLRRRLKADS